MLTKRRTIKREPHIKESISAPSFMDRRTFLKQSGLAASAAALPRVSLWLGSTKPRQTLRATLMMKLKRSYQCAPIAPSDAR